MKKLYLVSTVFLVALTVLVLTPTSVQADSDNTSLIENKTSFTETAFNPPSGSLDIVLDFRRDGRVYFEIDTELESSESIGAVTSTATTTKTSDGLVDGDGGVSGSSYETVPSSTMPTSSFLPTTGLENLSLQGDISLELKQPTAGEFKLDANGWVTVPSKYKSWAQVVVGGYSYAPGIFNDRLLQMMSQSVVGLREKLPSQFSDLQLKDAEIKSLSLKGSKLNFDVTFTLSSEMFKKDKVLAQIGESRFGGGYIPRTKELVEEFFNSLPLKVDAYFDLSMSEGDISLDLDSEAFKKGTKWMALDFMFDFSKDEKSLSTEMVFKKFEKGEVTREINFSAEGSEEAGVISGRFSFNTSREGETLLGINGSLEWSKAQENMAVEGSFYTPRASADLTASMADNIFKAHIEGWVEVPHKGKRVQLRGSRLDNLINQVIRAWSRQYQYNPYSYTSPTGTSWFGKMKPGAMRGMIENVMRKVLMNIDVNLSLKVPDNADVSQLPSNYEKKDNTYSWTGDSAKEALLSLLLGKFGRVEYSPGITEKIENITTGKEKIIDFGHELDVRKISIVPKAGVGKLKARVTHVNKPKNVSKPSGITHQYLEISIDNADLVENAEIDFKVENTWVTQNNIDVKTIRLLKYLENEEKWRELPTKIVDSDENFYYCTAGLESFSTFAVTGSQAQITTVPSGRELPLWLVSIASITIIVILIGIIWNFLRE